MFKNTAAKFMVFAFTPANNTAKTGDAANITAYVSKDYGAVTVLGDLSATEMDATNAPGYYLFDAAQAETNGDCLMISAKSATSGVSVIGAPAVIYTRPTTNWLAPATLNRTLVVDAAGLADANMVKCGPTGSGTAQTAKDIGGAVPSAAAGASGGLLISGSNSGTTTLGALTITGVTTHTGNVVLSDGLTISAPSTSNRDGLSITGNGTGSAINLAAGATGKSMLMSSTAGACLAMVPTGGPGINITASGNNNAVTLSGSGTGHGISTSGGSTSGDGFRATLGGTGADIRGNITGTITTATNVTTVNGLANSVITNNSIATDTGLKAVTGGSGTLTAGSATTATLPVGASAVDNFYKGLTLVVFSGTGSGQSAVIDSYVGSTRVATLDRTLGTALDNTSGVRVMPNTSTRIIDTVANLTNAPTSGDFTATMKTSIGTAVAASAVASVTGSVGSVTGLTASDVGAIKAKTDKLTYTTGNNVDVNVQYVNDVQVKGTGASGDEWGPA